MSYDNPYSAPKAATGGTRRGGGVSEEMLASLRQTKPWVRLFSVIGFLSIALMLFGALSVMAAGLMMSGSEGGDGAATIGLMAMGVVYLLMALVYFFPALYLWQYASAIGRLLGSEEVADLEEALNRQKAFWKFIGILVVVMFGLMLLAVLASLFIPAFMAASL